MQFLEYTIDGSIEQRVHFILSTLIALLCFRALEMLQEINQLPACRTTFSRTAMINLLNFNLPVKFGLMGQLAPTDKISDGFYDVGKVCA